MSCMSAKITRVGKIGASSELVSEGIRAGITRACAMSAHCSKVPTGITAKLDRDAIRARLSLVCTPSIRTPYLEIEPKLIWVYTNIESTNDVFSNTTWHIK